MAGPLRSQCHALFYCSQIYLRRVELFSLICVCFRQTTMHFTNPHSNLTSLIRSANLPFKFIIVTYGIVPSLCLRSTIFLKIFSTSIRVQSWMNRGSHLFCSFSSFLLSFFPSLYSHLARRGIYYTYFSPSGRSYVWLLLFLSLSHCDFLPFHPIFFPPYPLSLAVRGIPLFPCSISAPRKMTTMIARVDRCAMAALAPKQSHPTQKRFSAEQRESNDWKYFFLFTYNTMNPVHALSVVCPMDMEWVFVFFHRFSFSCFGPLLFLVNLPAVRGPSRGDGNNPSTELRYVHPSLSKAGIVYLTSFGR